MDVKFDEQEDYISVNRRIFEKPSSSPVINTLVENGVIKSERTGGITVFFILAFLMISVIVLFFKFLFLPVPKIDTSLNFVPAVPSSVRH